MKFLLFVFFLSISMFAKVDINVADEATLSAVKHIGLKKARSIIDYRTQNGCFDTLESLTKVKGFGNKLVDKIKEEIEALPCEKKQ